MGALRVPLRRLIALSNVPDLPRVEGTRAQGTVAAEYNPIFEKIFNRVQQDGDEIIAYIAYGLYKQRKRDFLISRQAQLAGAVPAEEISTFHRIYEDEGQIDLVWNAAKEALGAFAVDYADAEKTAAVKAALQEALRGRFWQEVWTTAIANFIFAIGAIVLYLFLRFVGFDLLDMFRKLEQIIPPNAG